MMRCFTDYLDLFAQACVPTDGTPTGEISKRRNRT